MLVSEYIIEVLSHYDVDTIFGITGTAVNMLFVAAERKEGMRYVCPLHEQAASMAADGYSRVTGKLGVCIATSGPGVTNLITGVVGAYTESVPMLVIVGQASSAIQKKKAEIRYYGFQEFDTVKTFESFTKYAVEVKSVSDIGFEMEKAIAIAMQGRKGPVVISIPEDILYAEAITEHEHYKKKETISLNCEDDYYRCYELLSKSKKPVLLLGGVDYFCVEKIFDCGQCFRFERVEGGEFDVEYGGKGKNPWGVDVYGFEAEAKINREDFGLTWNAALETGGVLVGKDVKIKVELELNPAA